MAVDDFELLTPTEVDSAFPQSEQDPSEEPAAPKVRKLCACGCGEEVTGNRALKRGHSMGDGLPQSIFSGNDIVVFQAAMVMLLGAISAGLDNKLHIPPMEAEERQAIGEPLGRIAARHIPKELLKKMKPGDAADAIAIITVMSAYVIRITTMKKETVEVPTVATNGHVTDSGVSGLNQYQYRGVQGNQSQNGSAN